MMSHLPDCQLFVGCGVASGLQFVGPEERKFSCLGVENMRLLKGRDRSDLGFSSATKERRSVCGASTGRGLHAKTIYDASAFVPIETIRHFCEARTGQVAVIWNPLDIRASSSVSQPVVKSTDDLPSSSTESV